MLLAEGISVLQVEEEVEELKEMCRRRPEEEQESPSSCSHVRSPQKKKQVDACWQETLQRCHTAQEMGHDCVHTVTTVTRPAQIRSSDSLI